MQTPNHIIEWAEILFTRMDYTIKNIALKTGAAEALIDQWAKEGDWEQKRRSLLTSKQQQLDRMYQLLDIVTTRIKKDGDKATLKDGDLLIKYTTAIKKLESEASLVHILEVAKLHVTWLLAKDPAFCRQVTLSYNELIKERLKNP